MSSSEKASTGVEGLDRVIHHLRLGDNVVWQVDALDDYCKFARSFVKRALQERRRMIYMRFGKHEPLFEAQPGITIYQLDAEEGFESFSTQVHRVIRKEGWGTYYVFDCLSDLLTSWATDLMTGNFFMVTCPYLFELNTIAYFAILRNRVSHNTIARIRETTQLFLDVYRRDNTIFVHPIKVWTRYSPTMFLPHLENAQGEFIPVTSSVEASSLFSSFQEFGPGSIERKLDFWDHIFLKGREMLEREAPDEEKNQMLQQLCRMLIGRDRQILELAERYLELEDLLRIRSRMIGSGYIGGKSVGMLLARKILTLQSDIPWKNWLEEHDSFYIGSDLYYTYLVENGCWKLRMEQKKETYFLSHASKIREKILEGVFPEYIREQFYQMLGYFGQAPIIVRSSSLLEDGFGNAFAGKYESVFCVNQGSPAERYTAFENALKTVYASTMNEDALAYRMQRGLVDRDEQMAVLVQRVSGSNHSQYFFPDLAGVAMSFNPYIWRNDIKPEAGMIRLVLGLGTRAVDRVETDYPRILALDNPNLRHDLTREGIRIYSQHRVDVLDTLDNCWKSIDLNQIPELEPGVSCWETMAEKDHETTRRVREMGIARDEWILTYEEFLQSVPFVHRMKTMLHRLEQAYDYPVDVEFTGNFISPGDLRINLLQCRPLQTLKHHEMSEIGILSDNRVLFATRNKFMGYGVAWYPDKIIYIDPIAYIELTQQEKYQVARLVGMLNRMFKDEKTGYYALIGPGRWGSTIPSLGVPVSFREICNCTMLVEVAVKEKGYMPELSFGTHFFQDLVETGIFYTALFPGEDEVIFAPKLIKDEENLLSEFLPSYSSFQNVIHVADLSRTGRRLLIHGDLKSGRLTAYFELFKPEARLDTPA